MRGDHLLNDRYELRTSLGDDVDGSELWIGVDRDEVPYLVRTWRFIGDRPQDVQRALWDTNVRVMYRVSSSAGARRSLVLLRDAGVDYERSTFVMVLEAVGQRPRRLADVLADPAAAAALRASGANDRSRIWLALGRIAEGIGLLHNEQVLHRNVGTDAVFLDTAEGLDSLRLAGFEWSTRIGSFTPGEGPADSWSWPPEFYDGAPRLNQLETDWFGFGTLATRLLLPVEQHAGRPPAERHERMLEAIDDGKRSLTGRERDFLRSLIAVDPSSRVDRLGEIGPEIEAISKSLILGGRRKRDDQYLVLAVAPNEKLADAAEAVGFQADASDGTVVYNRNDQLHAVRLLEYVRNDLAEDPALVSIGDGRHILVGTTLAYWLNKFYDSSLDSETWEVAHCGGIAELATSSANSVTVQLTERISVRSIRDAYDAGVRRGALNWESVLPDSEATSGLRPHAQKFFNVVRATNQIELLLRDAEIFPFRTVSSDRSGHFDRIEVIGQPRARQVPRYAEVRGGLTGFLRGEQAMNRPRWYEVVVSDDDSLTTWAEDGQTWNIESIGESSVSLTRPRHPGALPEKGFIRTVGMLIGQAQLMRRRADALERLADHTYLLDALASPGQVYMDTGRSPLPAALDQSKVDSAKRACIADVLRVRPLYALQGPPGTGKTTMVAWLLREIFDDDPVAQVLVTAQAHGAVDVLRDKVDTEVFAHVAPDERPISIRLASEDDEVRGGINDVAASILDSARQRLEAKRSPTQIEQRWLEEVKGLLAAIDPAEDYEGDESAADFREVLRRAASITYCTTSDKGLSATERLHRSFDWSIVEEAGKAHSFDLVMPLQVGHRWLLIGDHEQLPPYRFESYRDAISDLDGAVEFLRQLPKRGGNLVDEDWIREWEVTDPEDKKQFVSLALRWLETFRTIFEGSEIASGAGTSMITTDDPQGAAAGMLTQQHRMHPAIGSLISQAYYKNKVTNMTEHDGIPLKRVQHGCVEPVAVMSKAIVWLDTPWSMNEGAWEESGDPRYTNEAEAIALCDFVSSLRRSESSLAEDSAPIDLALLSPYNHQVKLLRDLLRARTLPEGVVGKVHHRRKRADADDASDTQPGFTVDSFQGAQAGIVGVSLARNNRRAAGEGLGFLRESSRMNVLLSRAERMLILAGSWDFFTHQVSNVDPKDEADPLHHWWRVIHYLDNAFASGSATRIRV